MHIDQKKGTGIVVALKANFLIVEINNNFHPSNTYLLDKKVVRLLCTKRSRLSFNGSFVCVGDVVKVESIDWKRLRGVVSKVEARKSFINRPPVANLSHVLIAISLKEPLLDQDQISRFLLTAEQTGQKIIVILTKRDLIEKDKL